MKNRRFMCMMITMLYILSMVTSVYGAEIAGQGEDNEVLDEKNEDFVAPVTTYAWELVQGETLCLPESGEILEYDEELFLLQEDGSLLTSVSGEGEIVVRYRVRITEPVEVPKNDGENMEELSSGEMETEELLPEDTVSEDAMAQDTLPENTVSENILEEDITLENEVVEEPVEEIVALPAPEVVVEEKEVKLLYDKKYDCETVPADFEPVITLPENVQVEVISCAVNGIEEPYMVKDNQLILNNEVLEEGKNRIILTVKDEQGNLTVMEPWEFMVEPKEKNLEPETESAGVTVKESGKKEQQLSLGMSLLIVGGTLVYYEKKKYLSKQESCD